MRQLVNGPEARKGKATGIQGERETDRQGERVFLFTHTDAHAHTDAHVHAHAHTHTHTHPHTHTPFSILSLCLAQLLPFFLDNTWPA